MIDSHLAADRIAWETKPALREVYRDCYRRIVAACRPGRTLEVGGGIGNLKEFAETSGLDIISSDIQFAPWLDLVCDAHALPFAQGSLDNIVMFDVLHHLHRPRRFFAEAERALTIGGRIVLVEPAITPLSWPFYKFFHPEPVRLTDDPLAEGEPEARERGPPFARPHRSAPRSRATPGPPSHTVTPPRSIARTAPGRG